MFEEINAGAVKVLTARDIQVLDPSYASAGDEKDSRRRGLAGSARVRST